MRQNAPMSGTVRPPRQSRSREAWQRVIDAATELFREGGYEALSISEVCRRARVSAPSIYARVDGVDGLFRAVYERLMAEIGETERRELGRTDGSIERTVAAANQIFMQNAQALRAIIRRATADADLLQEGARVSRELCERIVAVLPAGPRTRMAARTIYTECAFRVIYGAQFWDGAGESDEEFEARLSEIVSKLLI